MEVHNAIISTTPKSVEAINSYTIVVSLPKLVITFFRFLIDQHGLMIISLV